MPAADRLRHGMAAHGGCAGGRRCASQERSRRRRRDGADAAIRRSTPRVRMQAICNGQADCECACACATAEDRTADATAEGNNDTHTAC
jgi:hypothetical protein